MLFEVKGKIAIVTGAASGIGLCTAKELLSNGAQGVSILDVNEEQGQKAFDELTSRYGLNSALFIKTDVTIPDQLETAFKQTIEKWKSLDILINNAGIMNDGQWRQQISLNCTALVHGTLLALEYMGKDKGGRGGVIVNMGSILGIRPHECLPIYSGTKHFVIGFSCSLGMPFHYDHTGIKVIAVCPGITNTKLVSAALQNPFTNSNAVARRLHMITKFREWQKPEAVAQAIVMVIKNGENGSVWSVEINQPAHQLHIYSHHQ